MILPSERKRVHLKLFHFMYVFKLVLIYIQWIIQSRCAPEQLGIGRNPVDEERDRRSGNNKNLTTQKNGDQSLRAT